MPTVSDDAPFTDLDPATVAVRDLVAAARELTGRMARVMGMNANDMSAIGALTQNGPMGVVELAEHLGIRSASATVMVDRLERAGHVERSRDAGDRRRVTVAETDTARLVSYRHWGPLIAQIDEVARELSPAERDTVCAFLARVGEVVASGGRTPAAGRTASGLRA